MYATIRRYTPKGSVTPAALEQFRRQIHDEFIPLAQEINGFHGYYMLNVENRELLSISLFETEAGGAESTKRAGDYVRNTKLPLELGKPEVLQGEVLTFAEAAREVGAH